jgi:PTH1 family peptidyl-tRNA hydrolase
MWYVIGLGNPGEEYKQSRHNAGRMAVDYFKSKISNPKSTTIIESAEFMNNSGKAVAKVVKSKKAAQNLIVVYDDIDLPLGVLKIVWNRGSGGHKGLESVARAVKTKEFTRVRIGVSPLGAKNRARKPSGEEKVLNFILGKFKPAEEGELKKILKKASEAIQMIVEEGRDKAMNEFN